MRKWFSWSIAIVLFCWGTFGLLSFLSELKFLVDALDWSVDQVSIAFKDILLELGKRISQAVSDYRELVRGIARLLHLPHLPSWAYDALGMASLAIGRGYWIGKRAEKNWDEIAMALPGFASLDDAFDRFPLQKLVVIMTVSIEPKGWLREKLAYPIFKITRESATVLVYGSAVAIVLAVLFSIDYVYRHFA